MTARSTGGLFGAALLFAIVSCESGSERDFDDGEIVPLPGGGAGGVGGAGGFGLTATGGGGDTTTGTAGQGAGAGPTGSETLGMPCEDDGDCEPLICLTPDSGPFEYDGGPEGGLCTTPCTAHSTCEAIDPDAVCMGMGGATSYCLQPCVYGSATPQANKCRGRLEVACMPLTDQNGNPAGAACLPVCVSDARCGPGLYCNFGTGNCQPSLPAGDPIGTTCDPSAMQNNCMANLCACANVSCTEGFCYGLCTSNDSAAGCGSENGTAACLLIGDLDAGAGDLGFCAQLCECTDECGYGSHLCNLLPSQIQALVSASGYCFDDVGGSVLDQCCSCVGKVCGDDGCGGSCGSCGSGEPCINGQCCTPDCAGKNCGDDGCGGDCGTCAPNEVCGALGVCQCVPDCSGMVCGDDGCGGSCGACLPSEVCDSGQCCTPDCAGKVCGSDGCGGTCGTCAPNEACTAQGQCVCAPDCAGKNCGPDGCGGDCGTCQPGATCMPNGTCCAPDCAGKNCGDDGCGGDCGTCQPGATCMPNGTCCANASPCFNDGDCCGQVCDEYNGQCVSCIPLTHWFCFSHSDCCSGLCDGVQNYCTNCLTSFDDCDYDWQCCSQDCSANGWCN